MQRALGLIIGMCMGIGSAYAEVECKQHEPSQPSMASELVDQGYTEVAGGPLKGEAGKELPKETTAMLMVNPDTSEYKILVTTARAITCVYMEGMSWTKSDAKN